MRKALTILIIMVVLPLIANAGYAQQTNWATVLSTQDMTGNVAVQEGDPLLAGHAYNLTLSVDVPFTQSLSNFTIKLDAGMASNGPQFWYILTPDYGGYDPTSFKPGSHSISFRQAQGEVVLAALFTVPTDFTSTVAGGLRLRFAKTDFQLITMQVTGGAIVGIVTLNISDDAIRAYVNSYAVKSTLISSGKVDAAYSTLVDDMLYQANFIYQLGLPEVATSLLNILSPEVLPAPPNPLLMMLLSGAVVVVALAAALFSILFLRVRARHGFTTGTVSEVQKELASLEVTAARYDKALADRLRSLKDKLGDAI